MRWLQLGLIGNHDITFELDDAEADAAEALITEAMNTASPVGHLRLKADEHTVAKISLRDIVIVLVSSIPPVPPTPKTPGR